MAGESKTTTDHDEIRRWVEERGGRPARVTDTGSDGDPGILRIDFPGRGDEERERLRRGALDRELEPAGFEAMAALAASAPRRPRRSGRRADDAAAKRRARVEEAQAALREARARARELGREAERAEREAKRARTAADRAEADVEKAERALARARS